MPSLNNQPLTSSSPVNPNGYAASIETSDNSPVSNGAHDRAAQPAPVIPFDDVLAADTVISVRDAIKRRPRTPRLLFRYVRVIWHFGWLFVRLIFWHLLVANYASDWVDRTSLKRWTRYARDFRGFAIGTGGLMIKLGQFVSTRSDILPDAITSELASLRDEVPSVPTKAIRAIIEREIGAISQIFAQFSDTPVAAASLGQVHRARLHNGDRVVIKVQRPGIDHVCYTDLAAMFVVARIAMRFRFISKRMDAVALIDEFGRVLLEELSYRTELRNARRFARMFADDFGVYVPAVYDEISTDRVIVMEDVTTIKLDDYRSLEAAGISRSAVAKRLSSTYLRQIFEERFFHADPHPGNLFVYPLPEGTAAYEAQIDVVEGRPFYLIFIDFGMTGTLTPQIVSGLVGTMAAVVTRDAHRLIESYSQLGFLLPGADTERIEAATRAVFDQVWGLNMAEMTSMSFDSMANIAVEFNDLLFSMPFQVPQDFIYLGRTVSILSGLCTSLDPQFNPWEEMAPYTQTLIADRYGDVAASAVGGIFGSNVLQTILGSSGAQTILSIGQSILGRPAHTTEREMLDRLDRGDLKMRVDPGAALQKTFLRMEAQSRRTTRAILFSGGLVSGAIFHTNGEPTLALISFGFAGVMFLLYVFTGEAV